MEKVTRRPWKKYFHLQETITCREGDFRICKYFISATIMEDKIEEIPKTMKAIPFMQASKVFLL
jgi:hypothetical protein